MQTYFEIQFCDFDYVCSFSLRQMYSVFVLSVEYFGLNAWGIDGLFIFLIHQKVGIYGVQEQKQSVHVVRTGSGTWKQSISTNVEQGRYRLHWGA